MKTRKCSQVWSRYEQAKRDIERRARSSEEYERMIGDLCKRLKI